MKLVTVGLVSSLALASAAPAFAQSVDAVAATDLNIRSGPGPYYDVVGVIAGGDSATVTRCLDAAPWCEVSYNGATGWSSADYLAVGVDDTAVALATRPPSVTVETVTVENVTETQSDQAAAAAAGGTIGALAAYALGGPIAGIAAGGILGAAGGVASVEPTEETITYVTQNPVETVYLDGEVVVGAGIPAGITTYEVPQEGLRYLNVNGQTVLVDANSQTIVRVIR